MSEEKKVRIKDPRIRWPARKSGGRCWIAAGKGGSGKSALLNSVASIATRQNRAYKVYDMDDSNPTSKRLFKLEAEQVVRTLVEAEVGYNFVNKIWPDVVEGNNVLLDLGGSGEVPFLSWAHQNDASALTDDQLIFLIPVGTVDGVGTARTIIEASPHNPVILFRNMSQQEVRLATESSNFQSTFDRLYDEPNVIGVCDFPDIPYALHVSSRLGVIMANVDVHTDTSLFERGAVRKGLGLLETALEPFADYLP